MERSLPGKITLALSKIVFEKLELIGRKMNLLNRAAREKI